MAGKKAPTGLGSEGIALWDSVTKKYALRVDELSVLRSACKVADMIGMFEQAHADLGAPMLARGSMGQDVIHPLIAEQAKHHAALAAILAKLKLPDDADDTGKSNQQRSAAQTRWSSDRGARA